MRPRNSDGLMPFTEIAHRTNLTPRQVRRIFERGMRKLRAQLLAAGIDEDTVIAYFRLRDERTARRHENIAALLPPSEPYSADPDSPYRYKSLRGSE